jgi:hypothetical protein
VTATAVIGDGLVLVDGDTIAWVSPAVATGRHGWPDSPEAPPLQTRSAGASTVLTALADAGELSDIHVEGPILSTARCGAQDPDLIQTPDADLVRERAEAAHGHLVTMTVAPDPDGVTGERGVIDALVTVGTLPSFGHTDASWTQTRTAVADARARLDLTPGHRSPGPTVTQLFNGMRPLAQRCPGPIPKLLAAAGPEDVVVELIGDGTHVAPELVRSVFELVGAANVVLVTDAMADNSVGRVIETLLRNDVIMVDEVGFAPLDDTGTQLLFRFVAAAYERRSLAIASHWSFEDWGRFLPEHTTAASILDRLLHHATVVITSGNSYRMRESRQPRGGHQITT